jgi:3-hydroxyisobutyrate dehydrogenase-like beta-hydroxyacid dehydrogenase
MPNRDADRRSASTSNTVELAHRATGSNHSPTVVRRSTEKTIGFIGLGRMGTAMATNLVNSGCCVKAYVRHPDRAGELIARGLQPSNNITDLFDCSIVITMLPDDQAVREIVLGRSAVGLDGLALGLAPGAIHLSMSTISTAAASEFVAEHVKSSQGYVAAPVFGNPDAATARQLFIIAAGAAADIERCRPIFDILGQQTFAVGDDPASANLIKLAGNAMAAATLEILSEVLALARKRGLDADRLLDILTGTMFGGRAHKIYGRKIASQTYTRGGFVFPLALKDLRLALAEAEAAAVPMPSVSVVRDRLIAGIARGYSELDWSALGLLAAEEAGLKREGADVAAFESTTNAPRSAAQIVNPR